MHVQGVGDTELLKCTDTRLHFRAIIFRICAKFYLSSAELEKRALFIFLAISLIARFKAQIAEWVQRRTYVHCYDLTINIQCSHIDNKSSLW